MNANGKWDQALEPGWAGVTVTLTDDEGRSVTGVTQADGTVKLSPGTALSGGKYRIEVMNPDAKVYFPGAASARTDLTDPRVLSSNVEFVDLSAGKNVEVTTSFWSPEDYCQKNATLVTACQNPTIPNPAPDSNKTLTSFPFNTRGDATVNPGLVTTLANNAQTGTLWGIGYNKVTKQIFSAAYAKRGTKYGPGGSGGIYRTDPATHQTVVWAMVPNPGTTVHNPGVQMDEAFGPVVGKESLGDLDVSPDGKDLYVVNMHDRRLYRYDATQATAAAPKASYSIPDPGCAAHSDWRPYGLGIQGGKVYVGGVCSGESTHNKADMRGVVQVLDPVTGQFTATVMDQPLDFPRGGLQDSDPNRCSGHGWYPWQEVRPATQDGRACNADYIENPEPEISDINFETDGDMVVGFGDRFSDRSGWLLPATSAAWPATTAFQGGDIALACRGGNHMYVLDGNGGCVNHATPANDGDELPNVKEYYPGDNIGGHQEISSGGIAVDKVESTIPFSAMDPIAKTGSGVAWVDRTTGTRDASSDGLYLSDVFGKTRGIGDLEVLCDQAPLQLGNRVWQDTNENGIQDPGEAPVAGATVNLYDANGNKIGTAVTNSRGEYYFDSTVTKNVSAADLVYGRTYTIKMDNPDDYAAGGVLQGWVPTRPNQGDDDQIDSSGEPDGNPFPAVVVNPAGAGQNDHGADFGFKKPSVDLSIIKVGPAKVDPAGEVVYNLIVTNNGPNDSSGWTVTDPLPAGMLNPHTSDAGCGIGAGTLTCTGGPLKVGESHTITVRGLAPATGPAKLDNCATVRGNEQDPNMQNNNSCVTTDIPGIPLTDPGIAAAFAVLTGLGTAYYRRRRHTTGAAH
ncbi:SdrD B-like domain-containing protein [Streptomyces sp. L2]|uniref:SdrD B-like domain-containing protein n=1 Tax=Streptomyces sp. L2 TaxID=2162665 RepID=UPI001011BAE0|nr:SdrD B-like domain-containing protein [Streptomyces sp. L2]